MHTSNSDLSQPLWQTPKLQELGNLRPPEDRAALVDPAVRLGRRYADEVVDVRTLLDREAETHLRCGQTGDHKEGVRAFQEKRKPEFKGA